MSIERGVSRAGGRKEEVNKKGMKEGVRETVAGSKGVTTDIRGELSMSMIS